MLFVMLGVYIYRVGQNHIHVYIWYFWQGITKYTVITGVYIRSWPTLHIYGAGQPFTCTHVFCVQVT
jgi:hypothetical protein